MKIKLGIFDSGIGGFSVLNSLIAKRTDVNIIYLADTKRIPYGEKNKDEIKQIAFEISNWFKDKKLDALLVACNTTNACALNILKKNLEIPIFDLINSVSEIVSENQVGVLATTATIKSSCYKKTIGNKGKRKKVFQQACPEFVDEIERIPINYKRIDYLAEQYLKPLLKENIQVIILGCSHYPLIYEVLRKKIPIRIQLIDPSIALIEKLNNSFQKLSFDKKKNLALDNVEFFATGKIDEFSQKVTKWLGIYKKISLVNLRTDA